MANGDPICGGITIRTAVIGPSDSCRRLALLLEIMKSAKEDPVHILSLISFESPLITPCSVVQI